MKQIHIIFSICLPGCQSMLTYATVSGHIVGWDQRCQSPAWSLTNDPRYGLITSIGVNPSHCWMATGTYSGMLVCWDLRFRMAINKIQHPSGRPTGGQFIDWRFAQAQSTMSSDLRAFHISWNGLAQSTMSSDLRAFHISWNGLFRI